MLSTGVVLMRSQCKVGRKPPFNLGEVMGVHHCVPIQGCPCPTELCLVHPLADGSLQLRGLSWNSYILTPLPAFISCNLNGADAV